MRTRETSGLANYAKENRRSNSAPCPFGKHYYERARCACGQFKPLTAGQRAALQWLNEHPATLLWNTSGDFHAQEFWREVAPATIQSFHSLARVGLAEVRQGNFYYISEDGKAALK